MKVALLAFLGLFLGALGGAALGIGAGLAWVELFKTTSFEGYSGMLVFFTFMPAGAVIGGIGGAVLFVCSPFATPRLQSSGNPCASPTGKIRVSIVNLTKSSQLCFAKM